jgi:zinc protease
LSSQASAQARDWPSETPPRPLTAHEVTFPPYEIRTLGNGMRVVAVLHHEQPAVSIRLLVAAGSAQDPKGKGGVANLMASLLDQGTTTRSAQQIADQIDFIGGDLGTGAATDLSFVNAIVMKDSFQTGMDLLADVVRNPAFAPEEIERQKDQILSSIRVNADDPGYISDVVFDRLVYGFHPYGLPGTGTEDSLSSLTREDLQAFHRQYFVPNNMILAIVGDVTNDEAFAAAERVFGGWPRGMLPAAARVEPPAPARRIVIVDKPDAVQTSIRVGQLAIPRKHPEYMTWDLTVKILGGEGANRLHQVLRSQYGLTYGAEANAEARKDAGDFVAETDTRTDMTGQALRLMVDEFSRLARERVGQRELADAQAYLAGSFPLTIETPDQIATQVLNVLFYDLPISEIGTFRERVLAVTPEDIQRVARQYVRPDRLSIVLVGNARAFASQLIELGFGAYEVIPVDQLDLMAPNFKRERRTTPPPRRGSIVPPAGTHTAAYSPSAAVQNAPNVQNGSNVPNVQNPPNAPNDLIQRIVAAKGGLQALKSIRTVCRGRGHDGYHRARSNHHPDEDLRRLSRQVPRRCDICRSADDSGVQQRYRVGEGSGRRGRGTAGDAQRFRRDRPPRHIPSVDRGGGGEAHGPTAARRGQRRSGVESGGGKRSRTRSDASLYRSRLSDRPADVYDARPGREADEGRGTVLRLPKGEWDRRAVQGVCPSRRPEDSRPHDQERYLQYGC